MQNRTIYKVDKNLLNQISRGDLPRCVSKMYGIFIGSVDESVTPQDISHAFEDNRKTKNRIEWIKFVNLQPKDAEQFAQCIGSSHFKIQSIGFVNTPKRSINTILRAVENHGLIRLDLESLDADAVVAAIEFVKHLKPEKLMLAHLDKNYQFIANSLKHQNLDFTKLTIYFKGDHFKGYMRADSFIAEHQSRNNFVHKKRHSDEERNLSFRAEERPSKVSRSERDKDISSKIQRQNRKPVSQYIAEDKESKLALIAENEKLRAKLEEYNYHLMQTKDDLDSTKSFNANLHAELQSSQKAVNYYQTEAKVLQNEVIPLADKVSKLETEISSLKNAYNYSHALQFLSTIGQPPQSNSNLYQQPMEQNSSDPRMFRDNRQSSSASMQFMQPLQFRR